MTQNGHASAASTVDKKAWTELTEKGVEAGKKSEQQDYDPYEHRQVLHPTTYLETLLHLLKGSLGTGVLAMPNAFKHAGYAGGVVGTVVIGLLCTYCLHQLVKAEHELCRRRKTPSMSYPTVAEAALSEGPVFLRALAPCSVHVVNTFLLIFQLGTCCVYVVFIASNIKSIADYYLHETIDVRIYMSIILVPLILINWVRNLKYLAPFSTAANVITLISFGLICFYIFREPVSVEKKQAFGTAPGFSLFFGMALSSMEAIGIILPLGNEMKKPQLFGGTYGVVNVAMVLIVSLYVSIGLIGYLNYGNKTLGSITFNLPAADVLAQCVKGLFASAIFLTHVLAFYAAVEIIWKGYVVKKLGPQRKKLVWEYVVRTLLVLVSFMFAVAIPNLELYISLFGSLCLAALGLVFPALIQICTHWHYTADRAKIWLLIGNVPIIFAGILGLIIGTYTSLAEIIATFE